MPTALTKAQQTRAKRFTDRMSIYGLEFAVSMITLLISTSVLSFAVYGLCNYLRGTSDTGGGYFTLWIVASAIVWVPVAFIFYMRSRGYDTVHKELRENAAQRVFVLMYQIVTTLFVIGFSFAAIYSLFIGLVQAGHTMDTLVRVTLPSLISALLFAGALIAFFRHSVVSRKVYSFGFLVVAAVILIPVVVLTIVSLRSMSGDSDRVSDLSSLQSSIQQYALNNQGTVPSSLSMINTGTLNLPLSNYEYKKITATRYQLCTDFSHDASSNGYNSDFASHHKGHQCFTELTYGSYGGTYPDPYSSSNQSPSTL